MSGTIEMSAVEIAVKTDPGRDPDKQVNEDASAHVDTSLGILVIVCDGMGGHAGGKEASELAVKTIVERVKGAPEGTSPRDALKIAIEEANASIWNMPTAEAGLRPGSTVVTALIHGSGVDIAHVGDSRIYLLHAGAVSQVTRDHSMVQELVDRNLIRAEDAAKHPDANKILRALGIAKDVEVEVRPEPIAYVAGDVLVLCSDGLSDLLAPSDILEIAGTRPPAQAAGQLVDLANARGGHDNITAVVLRFRTSAVARDPATIVKTVQLTQHEVPADRGSGPKGTLVAAPIAEAHAPPTPVAMPRVVAGPVSERRSPPTMIYIGVALAVAALGLIGVILYMTLRPVHHNPKVVDDDRAHHDAGSQDDEDAGPEPAVTPAPPLVTPPLHPHHDGGRRHAAGSDGGSASNPQATATPQPTPQPVPPLPAPSPEACTDARRAKAAGLSPALVSQLEAKCRAAGGTP